MRREDQQKGSKRASPGTPAREPPRHPIEAQELGPVSPDLKNDISFRHGARTPNVTLSGASPMMPELKQRRNRRIRSSKSWAAKSWEHWTISEL